MYRHLVPRKNRRRIRWNPSRDLALKVSYPRCALPSLSRHVHIFIQIQITDTRIVVALDTSDTAEDLEFPERCRVVKLANSTTYDRCDSSI